MTLGGDQRDPILLAQRLLRARPDLWGTHRELVFGRAKKMVWWRPQGPVVAVSAGILGMLFGPTAWLQLTTQPVTAMVIVNLLIVPALLILALVLHFRWVERRRRIAGAILLRQLEPPADTEALGTELLEALVEAPTARWAYPELRGFERWLDRHGPAGLSRLIERNADRPSPAWMAAALALVALVAVLVPVATWLWSLLPRSVQPLHGYIRLWTIAAVAVSIAWAVAEFRWRITLGRVREAIEGDDLRRRNDELYKAAASDG